VRFDQVGQLLDPAPLAIEMGYERLDDGVLHVAVRTDLRGCTGEMFEWWFRFRPDTQQYIWWHPIDHEFSEWSDYEVGTHVGSVHHARESFSGLPAQDVTIQFCDPIEFFDQSAYEEARSKGSISAAVCLRRTRSQRGHGGGRKGAGRSFLTHRSGHFLGMCVAQPLLFGSRHALDEFLT
jgi:DAPG hydrolase PhiG domain